MEYKIPPDIDFPTQGYHDKQDRSTGLSWESNEKRITTRKHLIFADSRDCVGTQSLIDAQTYFKANGGLEQLSLSITNATVTGINVLVTFSTVGYDAVINPIIENNKVYISRVQGMTVINGEWIITSLNTAVTATTGTFEIGPVTPNALYTGGGLIIRPADAGYPTVSDTDNTVYSNEMTINLEKKIKVVKSLSLIHAIIPRDIIPLQTYLPDFIEFSQFIPNDTPSGPTVRAATTANFNFTLSVIDGVNLVNFDRVLIKNQTNPVENGIYVLYISAGPTITYSRADDMFTGQSVILTVNYYVKVLEGTVNADTSWIVTAASGIVNTGSITWASLTDNPMSWDSYIPQLSVGLEASMIGFYSTPLELFRTYINGSFPLPNAHTPPPLQLWNPTVGGVTHQLQPYPFQTVPTYTSDTFNVLGRTGDFYLICSGYGLYDLNDWTYTAFGVSSFDATITNLIRRMLLYAIVSRQTYRDADYIDLVSNCFAIDVGSNDPSIFYGYGQFQRFIPGPGLGMAYQPGTRDGADPTVTRFDSPVPFPQFRGNVWGPYNGPGDRFQKMGVRDTLQDLYLNGDTVNLYGTAIIKPWVKTRDIPNDSTFGINFQSYIPITFGNFFDTTNPNILNAMRIRSNGYGALNVVQFGDNQTFTEIFLNAGGQGPDANGLPVAGLQDPATGGAWVENEVLDAAGTGVLNDEIAVANQYSSILASTMIVEQSSAAYVGTETAAGSTINARRAWADRGVDNGAFIDHINKYRSFITKELPNTNLIMRVFQAERDTNIQSSNANSMDAIFSCPIRLNLGSTSGTQEYIENIHAFLASSHGYWTKRYFAPVQSIHKLKIGFTTYNGTEIPLERMLQQRRSVIVSQQINRVFNTTAIDAVLKSTVTDFLFQDLNIPFLFDPLNPRLDGREKRNISLIFEAETYEYEAPGLYLQRVQDMLNAKTDKNNDDDDQLSILKASNYQQYSGLS